MPRKKTVQPEPLRTEDYGDFIVEIRDRKTQLIGRGKANEFEASEIVFAILHFIMDYYLSGDVKKKEQATAWLEGDRSSATLNRYLQQKGEFNFDERTLYRHIKRARQEWKTLKAALNQKNKSDTC